MHLQETHTHINGEGETERGGERGREKGEGDLAKVQLLLQESVISQTWCNVETTKPIL